MRDKTKKKPFDSCESCISFPALVAHKLYSLITMSNQPRSSYTKDRIIKVMLL